MLWYHWNKMQRMIAAFSPISRNGETLNGMKVHLRVHGHIHSHLWANYLSQSKAQLISKWVWLVLYKMPLPKQTQPEHTPLKTQLARPPRSSPQYCVINPFLFYATDPLFLESCDWIHSHLISCCVAVISSTSVPTQITHVGSISITLFQPFVCRV